MIKEFNVQIPASTSHNKGDITRSPIYCDLHDFANCDATTCKVIVPTTYKDARSAQTCYANMAKKYFSKFNIKVVSRHNELYLLKMSALNMSGEE